MALQKINWTQIDTPFVPSGSSVNLGSYQTPLDGVYVETLLIADQTPSRTLHDFFYYLSSGYTPTGQTIDMSYVAMLTGTNVFHGTQIITNPTGNSIVATRNIVVSGTTANVTLNRNGLITISGATGESQLTQNFLTLMGGDEQTGIALVSNDPIDYGRLYIGLSAIDNEINPTDSPAISQMSPDYNIHTIIGFQSITGWTNGDVTFYTPVIMASGLTLHGNIDITGQYLINGVPFTGFSPTNITVANYGGLSITTGDTMSTIYNSALDATISMVSTVGGIPASTTVGELTGKTLVQLFDDLLFPTALPTYTSPTITVSGFASQTLESGVLFTPTIDVYGTKNDAGAFTYLELRRVASIIWTDPHLTTGSTVNVPDQFGFSNPNSPNYRYISDTPPYTESFIIPAPSGAGTSTSTGYYGSGNYGAGQTKKNNKGVIDVRAPLVRSSNAPQAASTGFQSSTLTITGIYPYFYGTSLSLPTALSIAAAIVGGTATKVLSSASGTLSIPYNVSGQYIWFAYFENYTTKTKWYVNALDNGDINNSFITTAVVQAVNSPNSYWSGINFKTHWSVYPTIQNTIEFRNT